MAECLDCHIELTKENRYRVGETERGAQKYSGRCTGCHLKNNRAQAERRKQKIVKKTYLEVTGDAWFMTRPMRRGAFLQ